MNTKKIDLTGIKDNDLEKTSSFTDLMSRAERKQRKIEKNKEEKTKTNPNETDIEEMVEEKRRSTKDLTLDLEKIKTKKAEEDKKEIIDDILEKTQVLELTRKMKYNFDEIKEENIKKSKNGVSTLNVIGIANLICIGYYIILLVFTSYQDSSKTYITTGSVIVLMVLLFGLSVVTKKKTSNFFKVLNMIAILGFIAYNIYTILN